MAQEFKNQEILDEIRSLSVGMKRGFEAHDEFFVSIKQTLNEIESKMATKNQLNALIDVLHENKVMTSFETKTVKSIA